MYTLVSFATYWGSKYGGINAFNADFLSALGSTYQEVQVICIVSSAQDSDIQDAEKAQVRLIKLPYLPQDKIFGQAQAQTAIDALQEQNINFEPENTVWLGHDRISGEAAIAAAKLKGGRSALIHHMSYEAYEAFAETSQSALTKINRQKALFKQADLLLAVGPLLHEALADMVDKHRQDIHCVIPGLAAIEPRKNPPTKFRAFLSGRLSDDAKKVKQGHLGIAGFAHTLKLAEQHQIPQALLKEPLMLIRGVDFESVQNYGTDAETTIEDEWQMFAEGYAGKRVNLFTLPYTQNRTELYDELKAASVALMPSWHEGFGLVAWEAIAAEVPLILSKNSGVYHLLEQEACENLAYPVQVNGRTKAPYFDDKSLDNVANALKIIASSHDNAKSKASDLRQHLSAYTWPACAEGVVSFFNWSFSITNRTNTLSTSITQAQQITLPITGKPVVDQDHTQANEDDFLSYAESKQTLHEIVSNNIQRILKNKHIPTAQFAEIMGFDMTSNIKDITEVGLLERPVSRVLDALYNLSKQRKKQLNTNPQEAWEQYLYDVEQLCGWLLLKTVDPSWWFHNQHRMQRNVSQSITDSFQLQQPAYVEVIIARSVLQRASYYTDSYGNIKPAGEDYNVPLFDAVTPDATDIQLLVPIYKDIRRVTEAPQNADELLKGIVITANGLKGSRENKPIYYMVSETYLKTITTRPWFAETEQTLKGCLQFICCVQDSNNVDQPCTENQELLLEKVANILRLKNTKGNPNV